MYIKLYKEAMTIRLLTRFILLIVIDTDNPILICIET